MNAECLYKIYQQYHSIQTDSRKLQKDDLFFALKGPSFNGNHFAEQALSLGAAYVIADEELSFTNDKIIQVDNVLETLQQLAKFHRNQFSIPFIAITGSNGKTTTKELLHEVLSTTYTTYTTNGNLNNHIGVPLTILKIKPDAEMAVIEMGANHLNEIAGYCEYAKPTHGLITNIGKAHLEGFGSIENVKKGKGELFKYLEMHAGVAFVNKDDSAVLNLSRGLKNVICYGSIGENSNGKVLKNDPFIEVEINGIEQINIQTNLVGVYNLPNVLAAVCIGKYFKIDDEKIKNALENYAPSNSRSQLIKQNSNVIILDAYNANPGSMKAAIENFAIMQGEKKILLLGSMMELGEQSGREHSAIISLIDKYKWYAVVLVGKNFTEIRNQYINYEHSLQARDWLKSQNVENAHFLIKGSRSVQMEKILESF
ncbi:MAG: UDP-N-acetylmuramoyl-tripeptide--D-alanyl-D-alanine ligase [Bacteroidota bacterium]|nr:UDP-N-acetylmuramoyl-tripeptide--D-alanyl-D-alanine ligase [Bacteroidota bacterium]